MLFLFILFSTFRSCTVFYSSRRNVVVLLRSTGSSGEMAIAIGRDFKFLGLKATAGTPVTCGRGEVDLDAMRLHIALCLLSISGL